MLKHLTFHNETKLHAFLATGSSIRKILILSCSIRMTVFDLEKMRTWIHYSHVSWISVTIIPFHWKDWNSLFRPIPAHVMHCEMVSTSTEILDNEFRKKWIKLMLQQAKRLAVRKEIMLDFLRIPSLRISFLRISFLKSLFNRLYTVPNIIYRISYELNYTLYCDL